LKQQPKNLDFQLAAATALRQAGENLERRGNLSGLLDSGKLSSVARKNLVEMYGSVTSRRHSSGAGTRDPGRPVDS